MFYHQIGSFGFFSVKKVGNYCCISQIPVLVFFFPSVLLQPLEAD